MKNLLYINYDHKLVLAELTKLTKTKYNNAMHTGGNSVALSLAQVIQALAGKKGK